MKIQEILGQLHQEMMIHEVGPHDEVEDEMDDEDEVIKKKQFKKLLFCLLEA